MDKLVVEALSQALRQGGEVRLLTSGRNAPGLFKDNKTAARKVAIEKCLAGEEPLLRVVRTETVRKKEHRFVAITAQGIEFLVSHLAPDQAAELLSAVLAQAQEQMSGLEQEWARACRAYRGTIETIENMVAAIDQRSLAILRDMETGVCEMRSRTQKLLSTLDSTKERAGSLAPPRDEEDYRRFAHRMITAWKHTTDPASKEELERSLYNGGIDRIGKKGERVPFVSRLHECPDTPGVFPDDPVEIVLPGWQLKDEYLLAKAVVKAIPS